MKGLVVYFSRTGNTKKIAEDISKELNFDIEEILDKEINRNGVIGYLKSGKEAVLKKLPKIKDIKKDVDSYDIVIIGTPVWAFTMCSPIRTFISKNKFKNVAFFCTMGGAVSNTFKNMSKLCNKEPICSIGIKDKNVKKGNYIQSLREFIEKIRGFN